MLRKIFVMSLTLAIGMPLAVASDAPMMHSNLTAAEIIAKNIQARGGLQAWRSVKSLTWTGKLGAGGNQRTSLPVPRPDKQMGKLPVPARPAEEAQLPFVMEMERSRKVRLELQFQGKTAVQVYDGENGWKVRPFLNRQEVEPFSAEELKVASAQPDLDGPLVDYAAKGTQVEVEGMEKIEDHDAYKLKLTLKSGSSVHVWIDARTFLEAKTEGTPRRLDGKDHPVEVFYRDYRAVNGLEIPFVLETRVLPLAPADKRVRALPIPPEKIVIDKVEVNPKLDAALFTKPALNSASASAKPGVPTGE
jgi:hypothetical protein